jgi:hypothetical protein
MLGLLPDPCILSKELLSSPRLPKVHRDRITPAEFKVR